MNNEISMPENIQAPFYYKFSGKITLMGIIITIIVAAITTVILGFAYSYFTLWCPIVYFNCLGTGAYALILGFAISFTAEQFKIRNMKLVIFFALLFGLVAEYCQWVIWIYAYSKQTVFLWHPLDLADALNQIGQVGTWSIRSSRIGEARNVHGLELYIIWLAEAVGIIGGTIYMSWNCFRENIFCESCNCWVEKACTLKSLQPINNPSDFKRKLELGDCSELLSLENVPEDEPHTKIELYKCPNCEETVYIRVIGVTFKKKSKGGVEKVEKDIVYNLTIDKEAYRSLNEKCTESSAQ